MKEIFDARARALASRDTGKKHAPTERLLICEIGSQKWALPTNKMQTVVEATPIECPQGVCWRRYPCVGFLCWEVTVYPVVDFAQVLEPGQTTTSEGGPVYGLVTTPCLSLRLPRKTTLRELSLEEMKPSEHPMARARVDDIFILNWESLL